MSGAFRVWCVNKNEWESDACVIGMNGGLFWLRNGRLIPANMKTHIVEFFTGLKDKNGVEIYEGDKLLRYGSGFYTVEWSDNHCGFVKNNGNGGALSLNDCEREVTGNIHEGA